MLSVHVNRAVRCQDAVGDYVLYSPLKSVGSAGDEALRHSFARLRLLLHRRVVPGRILGSAVERRRVFLACRGRYCGGTAV